MTANSESTPSSSSSTAWSTSSLVPRNLLSTLFHSSNSTSPPSTSYTTHRTIYANENDRTSFQSTSPSTRVITEPIAADLQGSPPPKGPLHPHGEPERVLDQTPGGSVSHLKVEHSGQDSVMDKKKKVREKRILPARMRRVSSLLAGTGLEEHLVNAAESTTHQRLLLDNCVILLSADPRHDSLAYEAGPDEVGMDNISFFSDPDVAQACKEKIVIETPEFKLRDDSLQMGKTRGGAMKSEEDTSDAAYERRHRRFDNLEKKQRRLERERLVRDRQKLRERIEQLRTADPRMLVPLIAARELNQRRDHSDSLGESSQNTSSMRGSEAAMGLGRQHMSAEASANLQKVELLRKELIAEATDTLVRYDALLSDSASAPTHEKRKRTDLPDAGDASASDDLPRLPGSSRGRFHVTLARDRTSSGQRSTPYSYREKNASVRASPESTRRSQSDVTRIHARTAGGKFAPKTAIGTPGVAAVISPERSGGNVPRPAHQPRPPRPAELRQKAAREAEKARQASLREDGTSNPPPSSTASRRTPSDRRSLARHDESPAPAMAAMLEQRRQANKTGPSLVELDTADRRPKRVKLRLGARPTEAMKDDGSHMQDGTVENTLPDTPVAAVQRTSAEEEVETRLLFAAPGALSLEQAQAMMAAAMARAIGEAVADEHVPSAASSDIDTADTTPHINDAITGGPFTTAAPVAPALTHSPDRPIKAEEEAMAVMETLPAASPAAAMAVPSSSATAPAASMAPSPKNKYDTYDSSPATAYMPGRSVAARQRAAANIPSRRSSGRVKELSKGAFGEKVPLRASLREDFQRSMLDRFQAWGGVEGLGICAAAEDVVAKDGGVVAEEKDTEEDAMMSVD